MGDFRFYDLEVIYFFTKILNCKIQKLTMYLKFNNSKV